MFGEQSLLLTGSAVCACSVRLEPGDAAVRDTADKRLDNVQGDSNVWKKKTSFLFRIVADFDVTN
jgi:hypothetical protein